jgi:hypothetical protein
LKKAEKNKIKEEKHKAKQLKNDETIEVKNEPQITDVDAKKVESVTLTSKKYITNYTSLLQEVTFNEKYYVHIPIIEAQLLQFTLEGIYNVKFNFQIYQPFYFSKHLIRISFVLADSHSYQ